MSKIVKLNEVKSDKTNANRHTERGKEMIRQSMEEFGFAEAGTLDKNNRLIGGNLRAETAKAIGMDEAIIVDVDGSKPVFLRREDLDLSEDKARRLAYALNRVAQVSIDFNPEQVLADVNVGINLNSFFEQEELDNLLADIQSPDFQPVGADTQPRLDEKSPITCPHCGEEFVPT